MYMKGAMDGGVMLSLKPMEVIKLSIAEISDDEVLVKPDYVGIFGLNPQYYEQGRKGEYVVEPPFEQSKC